MILELITRTASAFYGFTPILIPQRQSLEDLSKMLRAANADTLITAAGSVPLQGLLEQHPDLKQVIWVVERTSRHMEWNEVPEGVGGKAEIGVWHDIIEERRSSVSADLPQDTTGKEPTNFVVVSKNAANGQGFEVVDFTQQVRLTQPKYWIAGRVLMIRPEHRCGCCSPDLSTSTPSPAKSL